MNQMEDSIVIEKEQEVSEIKKLALELSKKIRKQLNIEINTLPSKDKVTASIKIINL